MSIFSLFVPLNTCQDGCNIIRGAPPVLQDVQAQLARSVYIRMEHRADELDRRRLVGILFFEVHDKSECAILERSVCWTDNNGVPV